MLPQVAHHGGTTGRKSEIAPVRGYGRRRVTEVEQGDCEVASTVLAVFAPAAANAPSQIWSVDSGTNVTPHNKLWPQKNGWVIFSTDGQVVATSAAGEPSTDLWNVSMGSHLTTVTIPGSGNWLVAAIGPSGSEALFGSNATDKDNDFKQLYLYTVP